MTIGRLTCFLMKGSLVTMMMMVAISMMIIYLFEINLVSFRAVHK